VQPDAGCATDRPRGAAQCHSGPPADSSGLADGAREDSALYRPLPEAALEALRMRAPPQRDFTTAFLTELLQTSSRDAPVADILKSKVDNQAFLLDNPAKPPAPHGQRRRRVPSVGVAAAAKDLHKSLKQAPPADLDRVCGVLHARWRAYISDLLASTRDSAESLAAADLHGSVLKVVAASSTSCVGAEGTVLRESRTAFHLQSSGSKCRVVQKKDTVFECEVPGLVKFRVHGSKRFR